MSRVLNVSHSGFYQWRKRQDHPSSLQHYRHQLDEAVKDAFESKRCRSGSPRLVRDMNDAGHSYDCKIVANYKPDPGDFATATRRHHFDPISTPQRFIAILEAECHAKEDAKSPIGFVQQVFRRIAEQRMRPLSKSKILACRQCLKKLWLEVHRPELREDSAQTQASFETGHKVGEVAQHIYDPEGRGVLIDPFRDGFDVAIDQTNELLQGFAPIFEAVFATQGGLALADVMLRVETEQGPMWRMVEVKSATSVKDYYLEDVAVQGYLAKASNIELESIQLAHIDNQWTYPGDGDYQGLLKEVDLTAAARARETEVKNWIKQGQQVIARSEEPDIAVGPHCNKPHACGFQEYCFGDVPAVENPVYWLPNIRTNALKAYIADHDVTDMAEIPDELLNKQQLMVKAHTLAGDTFFDVATTSAQLAPYSFPAYFLDFESVQFAVPIWKGTRPYAQLVVQFSLHILDAQGVLTHEEFLDISGQDPRRALALKLVDTCGSSGPVFVYSAQFERGRINELAVCFADLAEPLKAINERLVDLLPIARECYYHPSQKGSWSIKSVLPAMAPELNYADLDGVQDGGAAVVAFQEAVDAKTSTKRKQEIKQQLLKYCMLDTFAMVVMWKRFAASEFKLPPWTEL